MAIRKLQSKLSCRNVLNTPRKTAVLDRNPDRAITLDIDPIVAVGQQHAAIIDMDTHAAEMFAKLQQAATIETDPDATAEAV